MSLKIGMKTEECVKCLGAQREDFILCQVNLVFFLSKWIMLKGKNNTSRESDFSKSNILNNN